MTSTPKVFVSYSHDSPDHKRWVLRLASDLREYGVDAVLDQWDLAPGQDISLFMQSGIVDSDRVLLICSGSYAEKADAGAGGVGYERLIVTAEMVNLIDTKKFIPIVRNNQTDKKTPTFLGPRLFLDFSEDDDYPEKLEQLLRELFGSPATPKPPLGRAFSATPPTNSKIKSGRAGPTGLDRSGLPVLDEAWFEKEEQTARKGLRSLALSGGMELRFALHDEIKRSQVDLLNSIRESEIHTFGWPIGITLDNRDDSRPRPYGDGIRAEVRIENSEMSGRSSYDYWALRSNGDFFLLQNLFEDERTENAIFFNTRIVRVTEALLFAKNLYEKLGVAPEARFSARITHFGLSARTLRSAGMNRHIAPRVSHEDLAQTEMVVVLGEVHNNLVEYVKGFVAPMFMLFDFQQFNDAVYEDIVRRFEKGDIS